MAATLTPSLAHTGGQRLPPRSQEYWKWQGSEMLSDSLKAGPGANNWPDSGAQGPECSGI